MFRLEEREPAVMNEECGATLAEAQALQKKHLELEAEINARYVKHTTVLSCLSLMILIKHN